jgi:hypothetical protein
VQSLLITYDLVGTDETSSDYKRLIEHLKSYPNWARVVLSVWVIRTGKTPVQVRDDVKSFLDANDRLFVATLTGAAAWSNVMCSNEWLKDHL